MNRGGLAVMMLFIALALFCVPNAHALHLGQWVVLFYTAIAGSMATNAIMILKNGVDL